MGWAVGRVVSGSRAHARIKQCRISVEASRKESHCESFSTELAMVESSAFPWRLPAAGPPRNYSSGIATREIPRLSVAIPRGPRVSVRSLYFLHHVWLWWWWPWYWWLVYATCTSELRVTVAVPVPDGRVIRAWETVSIHDTAQRMNLLLMP